MNLKILHFSVIFLKSRSMESMALMFIVILIPKVLLLRGDLVQCNDLWSAVVMDSVDNWI